jgi:hypothetical protein
MMKPLSEIPKWWRPARFMLAVLLCTSLSVVHAGDVDAVDANAAAALHAKYGALRDRLGNNQFQKPLHLDSSETSSSVTGDMHALINSPYATLGAALNNAGNWCDIMMLHINTKYCRASTASQRDVLHVSVGKKHDQPLDDAYRVAFVYRVATQSPNYLQVRLTADEGPLSTRDYRIVLEAIPLENGQTFVRLSYSYAYGVAGRLAMQTYLGTVGNGKVGFTVVGKQPNGQPLYIGGMRGLVERNTMRYYLAMEAFLGALSTPPQARLEKRMHDWFAATEQYPRQLHEMERHEYLDMKRREYRRQQAGRLVSGADVLLAS